MANTKENSTILHEVEETGETMSHGGLELEPPVHGTTFENPPDGGNRAWLIVLSCTLINAMFSIMLIMIRVVLLDSKMSAATGMDDETQNEVDSQLVELIDIYAPVAALFMILFGYQTTVCTGAAVTMVTVIFISYLGDDDTVEFIKFVLYGPTAIGMSFIKFGALIPVIEYFTTKRMRAIFLSKLGSYVGEIILLVILITAEDDVEVLWRKFLRGCSGLCLGIGFLGLTLRELKITMKENRSVTLIQKTVGLGNKELLKNLLFWSTCAVYFFYHWGMETPQSLFIDIDMTRRIEFEGSVTKALLYGLSQQSGQAIGVFTVWIVRKLVYGENNRFEDQAQTGSRLTHLFGLLLTTTFTMAIGCFVAPEAINFGYFFTFSLLFAIFFGINEGLRDDVVSSEFGRENIKIVEGLILMFVGFGGLITNEIIVKIHDWKKVFRYGGGMLLLSGCVTSIILALKQSTALDKIQSKISGNSVVPDDNRRNMCGTEQNDQTTVNSPQSAGPTKISSGTTRQQIVPSTVNSGHQPYQQSHVPKSSLNSGVQPYHQYPLGYIS